MQRVLVSPSHLEGQTIGAILSNKSLTPKVVTFKGRNRADAKRRALNYWYVNQRRLALDIRAFTARCRLQSDGNTILFYVDGPPT